MKPFQIAGDLVMDWITTGGDTWLDMGGVGNLYRGLHSKGIEAMLLTVYNPLYPVSENINLHPDSIQDMNHIDSYLRNYDLSLFKRFRQGLRSNVFTVKGIGAVVVHKDSCIRQFGHCYYADVRTPDIKGECEILRVSSTDDYLSIMRWIKHKTAIITDKDNVRVLTQGEHYEINFDPSVCIDDIGAGDCFNVGFLAHELNTEGCLMVDAIRAGIKEAQQKVRRVGVTFE